MPRPLTLGLTVGVVDVHVHGSVEDADQGGLVGAQGLMGSVDGLGLPVRPVDVLLKQSHGKDVWDVLRQNCRGHRLSVTHPFGAACHSGGCGGVPE